MKRTIAFLLSLLLVFGAAFSMPSVFAAPLTPNNTALVPEKEDVLNVQRWLNRTYGGRTGFGSAPETGEAYHATFYALLRAMQLELGIVEPADNFGPQTRRLYTASPLPIDGKTNDARYALLSAALICKGYDPGRKVTVGGGTIEIDDTWDKALENAVLQLKTDAGLSADSPEISADLCEAIYSTKRFTPHPDYYGKAILCGMQRYMNRHFASHVGLIPCDGLYDEDMVRALIYSVQAIEGLPTESKAFQFGVTTMRHCPTVPYGATEGDPAKKYPDNATAYTDNDIADFTRVIQTALIGNGFQVSEINGIYSEETRKQVAAFQKLHALPETGVCDPGTICALLQANGDIARPASACDLASPLTRESAKLLADNGFTLVGRYLTGTYNGGVPKALTPEEVTIILDAGLSYFPIYEDGGTSAAAFTAEKGTSDTEKALQAAYALGVPDGTVLYFAVDYDASLGDIEDRIVPYFTAIKESMQEHPFRVGVYGTRAVCKKLLQAELTDASFVSDISFLYDGNVSYALPANWSFDQFAEITLNDDTITLSVDKVAVSGRDAGVNTVVTRGEEPPADVEPGDADLSGSVTAADARLVLRAAVGLEEIPVGTEAFLAGDIDKDGTLTAADARYILRKAVGLTDELPSSEDPHPEEPSSEEPSSEEPSSEEPSSEEPSSEEPSSGTQEPKEPEPSTSVVPERPSLEPEPTTVAPGDPEPDI